MKKLEPICVEPYGLWEVLNSQVEIRTIRYIMSKIHSNEDNTWEWIFDQIEMEIYNEKS